MIKKVVTLDKMETDEINSILSRTDLSEDFRYTYTVDMSKRIRSHVYSLYGLDVGVHDLLCRKWL